MTTDEESTREDTTGHDADSITIESLDAAADRQRVRQAQANAQALAEIHGQYGAPVAPAPHATTTAPTAEDRIAERERALGIPRVQAPPAVDHDAVARAAEQARDEVARAAVVEAAKPISDAERFDRIERRLERLERGTGSK